MNEQTVPEVPQQETDVYPANPGQAIRFANNIMEEIYRGGAEGPNIEAIMTIPQDMEPAKAVGAIAGKIVGEMLGQLRATGKRPVMRLAFGAVKKTVEEVVEIGGVAGVPGIEPAITEQAIAIATNIIDGASDTPGQQEAQPQAEEPPPQAQEAGVMAMPPMQQEGM